MTYELTEEEQYLIEQGQRSKALLSNQDFIDTFLRAAESFKQQLFATEPKETKTREQLYDNVKALQVVLDTLNADVAAFESIEAQIKERQGEAA